jgi:mannose-6-phosphate isomerase-like protein (cupin superfamily)
MKSVLLRIIVATGLLNLALPATAQEPTSAYPSRPVTLVVPFAPGSPADILGRAIGTHMQATLKQPYVIDNRAGASTLLAAKVVSNAKPDDSGKAIIEMDGMAPNMKVRAGRANVSTLVWVTDETPAQMDLRTDRADRVIGVPPPSHGSILRVVDFAPVTPEVEALDQQSMLESMGASYHAHDGAKARHPYMHRTKSMDYAIVLDGEIDMLLDDSEVHLKAGDILIQQGTNHAWVNRSQKFCRVAFVLFDAHDPLEKL